mmetsp:Transcript_1760/g.2233  ORF Transcript_1760/g.2233 Transcript_1760/m.2233 type:complete len:103 (+) Transcript_1760:509-817(+)
MLVHLARGRLPWLYVDVKPGDNYVNIFKCKRYIQTKEIVGSLPAGFVTLIDYARNLDQTQTPDYQFIRDTLIHMAQESTNHGSVDLKAIYQINWNDNETNQK